VPDPFRPGLAGLPRQRLCDPRLRLFRQVPWSGPPTPCHERALYAADPVVRFSDNWMVMWREGRSAPRWGCATDGGQLVGNQLARSISETTRVLRVVHHCPKTVVAVAYGSGGVVMTHGSLP
jgi:hypothetical protein